MSIMRSKSIEYESGDGSLTHISYRNFAVRPVMQNRIIGNREK
jgi:hypothetical protein